MHVGWAVWCGVVLAVLARTRTMRVVGVGYPLLVTLIVVATGNHYLLDAVAGAALVLGFAALAALAPRLAPVRSRPGAPAEPS